MKKRIAVIDLGTNTFHLLIAEQENNQFKILYREKVPVKLGMGGINQGTITEDAIERGLNCLRNFKLVLDQWNVGMARGFGTSALRSAHNGPEVIQRFQNGTGLELRIITGDEEAEYICFGIRAALDLGVEKSLIVDIGGGSVEFIIANHDTIFWKQSIEMGAQRLLELYHCHDPIMPEEVQALEKHFSQSLQSVANAITLFRVATMVGSSGTFDTLSEIYCIRERIGTPSDSPETPLTVPKFHEIHAELISKNRRERLQIPGMIEMRVDMIVVASCLVKYLIDTFLFNHIRVSSYSLKEGVMARWAENSEPSR